MSMRPTVTAPWTSRRTALIVLALALAALGVDRAPGERPRKKVLIELFTSHG
jgi:hypothetical protein